MLSIGLFLMPETQTPFQTWEELSALAARGVFTVYFFEAAGPVASVLRPSLNEASLYSQYNHRFETRTISPKRWYLSPWVTSRTATRVAP